MGFKGANGGPTQHVSGELKDLVKGQRRNAWILVGKVIYKVGANRAGFQCHIGRTDTIVERKSKVAHESSPFPGLIICSDVQKEGSFEESRGIIDQGLNPWRYIDAEVSLASWGLLECGGIRPGQKFSPQFISPKVVFGIRPKGLLIQPPVQEGVENIAVHLPGIDDNTIPDQGQIDPADPGRHGLVHDSGHPAQGLLIGEIPVVDELHPHGVDRSSGTNVPQPQHAHLIRYEPGQHLVFRLEGVEPHLLRRRIKGPLLPWYDKLRVKGKGHPQAKGELFSLLIGDGGEEVIGKVVFKTEVDGPFRLLIASQLFVVVRGVLCHKGEIVRDMEFEAAENTGVPVQRIAEMEILCVTRGNLTC